MKTVGVCGLALVASFATAQKTLTVFAAASLREPMQVIASRYEVEHKDIKIQLNFGGSQQLAAQINQGAHCDVFASADVAQLNTVKLKEPAHLFATNRLIVVSPIGAKVVSFNGLAKVKSLVIAAAQVPAGTYARQALSEGGKLYGAGWLRAVEARVVSQEQDVRAVLAKLELGEADAGLVYVTDALSAKGKVQSSAIPPELNVLATYPVGIPAAASDLLESRHFIHALTDSFGQSTLKSAGFGSPFDPPRPFTLEQGSKAMLVGTNKFRGQKLVSFTAAGPHGVRQAFRGWPFTVLLGKQIFKTAEIKAADWYTVTISAEDLRKSYLVPMKDGNLQIIVPGSSPANWVAWLRSIRLK